MVVCLDGCGVVSYLGLYLHLVDSDTSRREDWGWVTHT